ncbi:PREDICTED: dipeptidyl aminopeptidase-like protein 6 [Poecilia mexicana]|uniref:dipeptidyl aminopeptidase-like protein 6 n=1 Tax=Poecilia mexicana TaxID=48701 RepID=UPI00072E2833|nr:PREDICTED: dipeptidyl aminopeptidase-like protein 6 [Poecilia mexicana]
MATLCSNTATHGRGRSFHIQMLNGIKEESRLSWQREARDETDQSAEGTAGAAASTAASPPRRPAAPPPHRPAASPPRRPAASPPRRPAASPPRRLTAPPPRRSAAPHHWLRDSAGGGGASSSGSTPSCIPNPAAASGAAQRRNRGAMNQSAGAAQHTRSFSLDEKDIGPIGPDRNWKGIGISLLVIMAVLSCIGLSIVLLSQDGSGKPLGAPLALDDLFQRSFQIHDPEAKWISGKFNQSVN